MRPRSRECRPHGPQELSRLIFDHALTGGAINCRPFGPSMQWHRLPCPYDAASWRPLASWRFIVVETYLHASTSRCIYLPPHPGPQTQVLFAVFLSVIVNFIFGEVVCTDALPVFAH